MGPTEKTGGAGGEPRDRFVDRKRGALRIDADDLTQAETITHLDETQASDFGTSPTMTMPSEPPTGELTKAESLLVRLVLGRGLATTEEVDVCLRRREQALGGTRPRKNVGELLVEDGSITRRQLERIMAEIDAESASQQLPGYRVHKTIGKGAGGMVLKATQVNLDRVVAIKVLPRRLSIDPKAVERLYAEGQAAAKLNHPNIVQAFDVGQAGDCHYFVMEFVDGRSVYDALKADGAYTEEGALDVIIPIAEALEHAHGRGLIHRDVKPRNIMITAGGVPKLADLGLARLVGDEKTAMEEKGRTLGTPLYISPEQIRGDDEIGPPADIYGLGATLHHMLTGSPPFEAPNRDEMFEKHLHEKAAPVCEIVAGVSEGLSEVVEKMMAKGAGDRYSSCGELLVELRAWKSLCVLRKGERGSGVVRPGGA